MGSDVLKTDVFVVGGGPAGLATGIALRQRRLSVVVADICAATDRQGLRRGPDAPDGGRTERLWA